MKPSSTLALVALSLAIAAAAPVASAAVVEVGQPEGSLTLKLRLENDHVHRDTPHVHVLATLEAQRRYTGAPQPVNLALVIDRSGSMSGQKIADARRAASEMVGLLKNGDRVSIVTYSDGVRVDVGSTTIDPRSRRSVQQAIRRIGSSGSTNLSGGLVAGHEQVRRHLDPDVVNRVLLISDGLANRGVTSVPALNRIAREAAQEGIVTTTLGLGADYNEDLMTSVADHGGGNYYFVAESEELAGVLRGELGQMMSTVAQQVTLELEPPDGVTVDAVFGYTREHDGSRVVVPLGDVFAGQRRNVLMRLRVPRTSGVVDLGELVMRYRDATDDGARRAARAAMSVTVTTDRDLVESRRDDEVTARIREIELATSMQRAAELVEEGKYDEARRTLKGAARKAKEQSRGLGAAGAGLGRNADQAEEMAEDLDQPPASPEEQKKTIKRYKAGSHGIQKQ